MFCRQVQCTLWPNPEGAHTPIFSTSTALTFLIDRRGIDLRVLPALVPERFRNESLRAVEVELTTRISKLKEKIDAGLFEQDSAEADDSPKTQCSFQLFAQLEPTNVPKDLMDELESEIDEPTGITTVKAPELVFEGVLLSQNCSILYEIKHTVGVQYVETPVTRGEI